MKRSKGTNHFLVIQRYKMIGIGIQQIMKMVEYRGAIGVHGDHSMLCAPGRQVENRLIISPFRFSDRNLLADW